MASQVPARASVKHAFDLTLRNIDRPQLVGSEARARLCGHGVHREPQWSSPSRTWHVCFSLHNRRTEHMRGHSLRLRTRRRAASHTVGGKSCARHHLSRHHRINSPGGGRAGFPTCVSGTNKILAFFATLRNK